MWVVLPKAHIHGALASYDNFVRTDWASGGAVPECECAFTYFTGGVLTEHDSIVSPSLSDGFDVVRSARVLSVDNTRLLVLLHGIVLV